MERKTITTYTMIPAEHAEVIGEPTGFDGLPPVVVRVKDEDAWTSATIYLSREQARSLSNQLHGALADLRDADMHAVNTMSNGPDGP